MIGTVHFLELAENINHVKNHVDPISFDMCYTIISFFSLTNWLTLSQETLSHGDINRVETKCPSIVVNNWKIIEEPNHF